MNRRFYSGNNLDQALMKAARDLEVPKEDLDYRQVEKRHGFLKIRRSVVIEVDPESPRRSVSDEEALERAQEIEPVVEAPAATPRPDRAPREVTPGDGAPREGAPSDGASSAARDAQGMIELPGSLQRAREKFPPAEGDLADATREALEILLDLAGLDMESSVLQGEERFEIELWGADQDHLLRDQGRPLLSLQHLLVRVVRGMTGEPIFCRVDCDDFHDIREERLRDLAQRVASQVVVKGRSQMLESMAPDERRIIHMTLSNDPNVETESQGNGYFKRVKVLPS